MKTCPPALPATVLAGGSCSSTVMLTFGDASFRRRVEVHTAPRVPCGTRIVCAASHIMSCRRQRRRASRSRRPPPQQHLCTPHSTRPAQPTRLVCCAATTSALRRSDRGAVLQAAVLLGEEASSPRASAALSCAAGLNVDGRAAAAAAGGGGGAPVSCGCATEAALGRLRYSNQPSSPRHRFIKPTLALTLTYHEP